LYTKNDSPSSFRGNIDSGGPLGRAVLVIIGAIAELERNLILKESGNGQPRHQERAGSR